MTRTGFWTVLALLVAGCNTTLKGEPAPTLPSEGWLVPGSDQTAELESEGEWVLVEFFSPT